MVAVEKLYDMEAATIYVEMDVPLFKIGRNGFPYDKNMKPGNRIQISP
jgi:hypothetical protein